MKIIDVEMEKLKELHQENMAINFRMFMINYLGKLLDSYDLVTLYDNGKKVIMLSNAHCAPQIPKPNSIP